MRERIVVCLMLALTIALAVELAATVASLLLFVAVRLGILVFAP